ncbi:MAG: MlaD family protein [Mycobacteriaceae bacterium]
MSIRKKAWEDEGSAAQRHLRLGLVGSAVMIMCLVVTSLVYIYPPGYSSYQAHFSDSGGVRTGDEIRIAGVKVGKVTSVKLTQPFVTVDFEVKDTVSIGNTSTLEVKLLTPLGGRYVTLFPSGDQLLESNPIPAERIKTPFKLGDIIDTVTPKLDQIDGRPLSETLTALSAAVENSPEALDNTIEMITSLTSTLADNAGDLDRSLAVTDQLMGTVAAQKHVLLSIVQRIALVGNRLVAKREEILKTFTDLNRLFDFMHSVTFGYHDNFEESVNAIDDLFSGISQEPQRLEAMIASLQKIIDRVMHFIGGQSIVIDPTKLSSSTVSLCIPNVTRGC